jgi:hypothetical protein
MLDGRASPSSPAFFACMLQMPITLFPLVPTPQSAIALDWAFEGVLSQPGDDGVLRPMAYFSAKHIATECNYEIYDKKFLTIIKCLKKWRPKL